MMKDPAGTDKALLARLDADNPQKKALDALHRLYGLASTNRPKSVKEIQNAREDWVFICAALEEREGWVLVPRSIDGITAMAIAIKLQGKWFKKRAGCAVEKDTQRVKRIWKTFVCEIPAAPTPPKTGEKT